MGLRPAGAVPSSMAVLPPELDGRIFPVGTADLALAEPVFGTTVIQDENGNPLTRAVVDGGVLRRVQSIIVPWDYTQDVTPTDTAIGTAMLVQWNATINDSVPWVGPQAQTGFFGPRGVYQLEGTVRYAKNMSMVSLTPIAFANQLRVTNTPDADRTITPGWAFMNNQVFQAVGGRKVTLMYNDTAKGMAGFVDNQVFTVEGAGSQIDGTTNGYEALSFATRNFVTQGVHLHAVIGFDMADINHPMNIPPGGTEPPVPPVEPGLVDTTIGVRVAHLSKGGSFGIGVQNGSRTVLPPQPATLSGPSSTIRTDASYVVIQTGAPVTLTSPKALPDGRDGQVVTLVNGSDHAVTIQGKSILPSTNLAETETMLRGDVIDLIFRVDTWHVRSRTLGWDRSVALPNVHPWFIPTGARGVTTFQSTHTDGSVTGIDLVTAPGSLSASTLRLFVEGDAAPRTVVSTGAIGFTDGTSGGVGTFLRRSSAGTLAVGDLAGARHNVDADVFVGGVRRSVNAVTSTGYAVVGTDRRVTVTRDNASASTMTWPSDAAAPDLPLGTEIPVCNLGVGAVSHQGGAGATVITDGAQPRGTRRVGVKVAANTWCVG